MEAFFIARIGQDAMAQDAGLAMRKGAENVGKNVTHMGIQKGGTDGKICG